MAYVNKTGSGSSSSSSFLASSPTAKDPYEQSVVIILILFNLVTASRTNNNNVDASAYSITTTGNIGFTPTTCTIQPMITTSEPSDTQRQQQNPTPPEVVTPRSPSQVAPPILTLSLGGQNCYAMVVQCIMVNPCHSFAYILPIIRFGNL